MRRSRAIASVAALLAALSLGLTACGDDDDSSDATTTETPAATTAAPATTAPATTAPATSAPAASAPVAVAADPTGQLKFEPDTLTAPAGEVTFAFTNESPVPHDFVIREPGGDDIGGTEVITASEEELTVTLEAGDYEFYCSVPGHEQAGMVGALTAE